MVVNSVIGFTRNFMPGTRSLAVQFREISLYSPCIREMARRDGFLTGTDTGMSQLG